MTTVREIASKVGVSPSTVSRALRGSSRISEEVRGRILREARRLGYDRGRSTVHPATVTLGVAFLNKYAWPQFIGYDSLILAGVMRGAREARANVMYIDLQQRIHGESYRSFLASRGIHGLLLRVDDETHRIASDIAAEGIDVAVIADRYDESNVNFACCCSRNAAQDIVQHLIGLGHRRIGFCRNNVLDRDHRDRLDGYRAALEQAEIEYDEQLHISRPADVAGGAAALNAFLSHAAPPTAIFFTDPLMTVGGLRRAAELGVRVPDELSIVGVDDGDDTRQMTYPIYTAVCQRSSDLGVQAARWLARSCGGDQRGEEPFRLVLEAYLEVNQSTAPPPPQPVRVTSRGQRLS
jgi:DNA-binding LacI/PurR family transcriptional regulator